MTQQTKKQILVFGDSISNGHWDKHGGWATRLHIEIFQDYLAGRSNTVLYNLSINGNTSADLNERIEIELQYRIHTTRIIPLIIIAIGLNDTASDTNERPRVDIEGFRDNVRSILELSKAKGEKVLYLTPIAVDESRSKPWKGVSHFSNEVIKKYVKESIDICTDQEVDYINLFETFSATPVDFSADGIHPNTKGHTTIYKLVREYLRKYDLISQTSS